MRRVELSKNGKTTVVNAKWLTRFLKDGWVQSGAKQEGGSQKPQIDLRAAINDSTDKNELEALMKSTKGVDLDKRKSLDNMKADALAVLDEG